MAKTKKPPYFLLTLEVLTLGEETPRSDSEGLDEKRPNLVPRESKAEQEASEWGRREEGSRTVGLEKRRLVIKLLLPPVGGLLSQLSRRAEGSPCYRCVGSRSGRHHSSDGMGNHHHEPHTGTNKSGGRASAIYRGADLSVPAPDLGTESIKQAQVLATTVGATHRGHGRCCGLTSAAEGDDEKDSYSSPTSPSQSFGRGKRRGEEGERHRGRQAHG
ncbi:hypothetical protein CDL15_Pgr013310 [Punica granatum]|uniref:Uncharacterized protein n=1 Tax=Punica granatum TaxID=22663 RepID=A0A218WP33_PUNGR|nr:hypothetical protein CDL15_Pgr013310 [Punica granatum]PKI73665.1 hypothetical protein CRG98_005906 [Punica granatum]